MIRQRGIVVVILAAALPAAASIARAQVSSHDRPAAFVDGEEIAVSEIDAVVKLVPPQPTAIIEDQRRQMRHDTLDMLIDDVLARHFLSRNGRHVEAREIDKQMSELQAALRAQKRSLQDFLTEAGQTEPRLRQEIQKKLQWDDWLNRQLSEDSMRRYYEEYKDFFDKVSVRASHILIRVPSRAGEAERQAARNQLEELHRKIVAGQIDFAEAARKYSQCTSAPSGGDIGYFSRKWTIDERIARVAFALPVGEISNVVESDMGFHIIKVTERKAGTPSTFEKARDAVRENCAADLWQQIVAEERKTAHIDIRIP